MIANLPSVGVTRKKPSLAVMILEQKTNPHGNANLPQVVVVEMTKNLSPVAKTQVPKEDRHGNANPPQVVVVEMTKNLSPDAKTQVAREDRRGNANPPLAVVTEMVKNLSLDAKTQVAKADLLGSAMTANLTSRENNPHGILQMTNLQEEDTKKEQAEVEMKNHLNDLAIAHTQDKMIRAGMIQVMRGNLRRGIHQVLGLSVREINPHGKSESATTASNTQTIWAAALKEAVASKSAMMVVSGKLQRPKNSSKPMQTAPYD
jgi:hypothetical protein